MNLSDLVQAMSDCNQDETIKLVSAYMNKGIQPNKILEALTDGIKILGERFSRGEAFIPELVFGGEIFKQAMGLIFSSMGKNESIQTRTKGKVVLATVKGDLHDIGKNLVGTFLSIGGYQVIDLGTDVSNDKLIDVIQKEKPDVVGLSALLTTTMLNQRQFIQLLKEKNLRNRVKVIVGGAPISQAWADEIGADAYGADAVDGKHKIDVLLGQN